MFWAIVIFLFVAALIAGVTGAGIGTVILVLIGVIFIELAIVFDKTNKITENEKNKEQSRLKKN